MNNFNIEAVAALASPLQGIEKTLSEVDLKPAGAAVSGAPASGFSNLIEKGLNEVNTQMMGTQVDLQQLATGNVENLHQVMIRLEESRVSFQLMMQVRSRLLEAYQDVMKMPI